MRAFGWPQGSWLRFWGSASLDEGERIDYSLPLDGPNPSFTFSWEDTLGQAGAVTVEGGQIPYPLPAMTGSSATCGSGLESGGRREHVSTIKERVERRWPDTRRRR